MPHTQQEEVSPSDSMNQQQPSSTVVVDKPDQPAINSKTLDFWLIIFALCLIAFASSLDGSIIAIALPHISQELAAGDEYVWIANSFVLAQTVVQPPCAQLCNIFGRRHPMILAVVVFALGSAIAGAAKSTIVLISGRTVQGLGSGGILLMVELIICDIVPLRERPKYLGIVMSVSAIGAIVGPIVGGALAEANWRWMFYLNLPIAGIVLSVMVVFLRLRHDPVTWSVALSRIDWVGNFIFIASICAVLLGLIFGGTVYAWSSWKVILPITLGVIGWALFHLYEGSSLCKEPCVPSRLFHNRTSMGGFYIVFISSMLLQWVCFFWPVYFQAVRGASPMKAGVDFLPFMCFLIPGASVAGIALSKIGRYRRLHVAGFLMSTIGPGLNALLKERSHKAMWAGFQMIDAIGRALLLPTVLPAILASLSEADVASATGMYSFLRSFGYVWGISVPGIIFNNRINEISFSIADPVVRMGLQNGKAYQFASGAQVQSLQPSSRAQVIDVYLGALKVVWIAAAAVGASGLFAVAVEKHVPLRLELETQYGLEEEGAKKEPALPVSDEPEKEAV
ncbi:major facilitator superfamily domain-containing protein [Clohesyomyces aquaticus]|uniref:Major facilitator superfamily domain-containing protein n=1 Tax=Clohesyomyces aquaticus TaxID=1231657 RepID=A0A1Y1YV54_9PLEO|nr:major facilitator superfamily domain-containing protein [Clohesyomyces aquaticus]